MPKNKMLTTRQFADMLGVSSKTPRDSLWRIGHYQGVVPVKAPNGRLLWSEKKTKQIIKGVK